MVVPNSGGHDEANPHLSRECQMSASVNGTNGYGQSSASTGVSRDTVRDPADIQMDQIRDLLFGQFRTELAGRFAAIESRLTALERQLAAARAEDEAARKASLDALAKGVATLGDHIRLMAKP